jgi:Ca-activated chloride channel family protein
MTFERPYVLLAIAFVVVLGPLLYVLAGQRARRRLVGLVAPRLAEQMVRSVNFAKRRWKAVIFGLGLCALCVALARPQYGFVTTEVERASVDFLVALDLSRSMLAADVNGKTRLDASSAAIVRLLNVLGSERVGLIGFAGEAFLAAPITQDHASVRRNLEALGTESVARAGSDIAAAIKLAQKTFEIGNFESRALIIITDGEELQGDALIAAREAARKGLAIFTIGVGSLAGARVPAKSESGVKFARNEFGREVISRLNERVLRQVAASGGGSYEALGENGDGLVAVWQNGLKRLAKGTRTKVSKDRRELFQWPLALAVGLLFAEMLINERRKRPVESRT